MILEGIPTILGRMGEFLHKGAKTEWKPIFPRDFPDGRKRGGTALLVG